MTRKTPKAVLALLDEHDATVAYWANKQEHHDGTPVTDDFRVGILTGMNIMLESALHQHGCYNGFRYVKHTKAENPDSPSAVNGYLLDWNGDGPDGSVKDATRSYFRKF